MPKMKPFLPMLSPQRLWQSINPWTFYQQGAQFGLVNLVIGQTPRPDVEDQVLEEVGSYGRQLGRIGDAMAVLMKHVDTKSLSEEEHETLIALKLQLDAVKRIKHREGAAA